MNRRHLIQTVLGVVAAPFMPRAVTAVESAEAYGIPGKPCGHPSCDICSGTPQMCPMVESDAWAEHLHDDWILSEADEAVIRATRPVPFTGEQLRAVYGLPEGTRIFNAYGFELK